MATGVLILGVGSGTKKLNTFLECTKSYETVILFGAATDSYDSVGKVVARKQYDHITKEAVEQALDKFRGKIMQRPPIFSALRIQGKRLYEYAREGKELPVEIQERPVEVEKLELLEWMDGGTHEYHWPVEEAEKEERDVVEKVLHLNGDAVARLPNENENGENSGAVAKRKRQEDVTGAPNEFDISPSSKRPKSSLKAEDPPSIPDESSSPTIATAEHEPCPAPACRLRMTVTSGFYVRSLCHDLGAAVGSLALMAGLVRTRQGDFELGKNVLEYADLAKGEEVWGAKVSGMLEEWSEKAVDEQEKELQPTEPSEGGKKRRNSSSDEA